jgi:hypothetical protein
MTRQLLLLAFLLSPSLLFAQKKQKMPAEKFSYDLREALAEKVVSLNLEGTGGHQGECLKLVLRNLKGKPLRVNIPIGQFWEPDDSTFQTLVSAEEKSVAVGSKTSTEIRLKTYCAQSGERSPLGGAAFSVGALAPENLCKLLKFIVEKDKTALPGAQNAVWCMLNGSGLAGIGDPELTRYVAELMGKNLPGYRVKHKTVEQVPGRPAELGKALLVEGNFVYYLEKEEKLFMALLDADGKQIKQISKEEKMAAGEHRSSLRLEVYNLKPGKYTVRIQTKAGRVIKDIEVEF